MSDVRLTQRQLQTMASFASREEHPEVNVIGLANVGHAGPVIAEAGGERYLITRDGGYVREENAVAWDREVVR